ncbi:MAG: cobalt ECF transporter T component CbiQ [Fibrobacteria bacterium]|nr:cobalt ECF transporter T component CbiQ [Fibrobacteria bacterium]
MGKSFTKLEQVKQWDKANLQESSFLGLDTRVVLITVLCFVAFVVSVPKYEIKSLIIYFAFPVFLLTASQHHLWPIAKKILLVSPFVVLMGVFNPFIDKAPLMEVFGITITGGMVSFLVIILKGMLSVSAIVILTSLIPFHKICGAMAALKVPQAFVVQILFLYRYIFVLVEEAGSMQRARDLRSFNGRGKGIQATSRLLGSLFIRTLDRSQRIYRSMLSRGFTGEIKMTELRKIGLRDYFFVIVCVSFFLIVKIKVL